MTINWELTIDILMRCWDEIPTTKIMNSWAHCEDDASSYQPGQDYEEEEINEQGDQKKKISKKNVDVKNNLSRQSS